MKGNYAIVGRIIQGIFYPENYIRDVDLAVRKLLLKNKKKLHLKNLQKKK